MSEEDTTANLDFEWVIHNFSRWNVEFLPAGLKAFITRTQLVKMYSGDREGHLGIILHGCSYGGDLTILGPDGSLLHEMKLDPGVFTPRDLRLDLKLDDVVARIRRAAALHGDRLTLRLGTAGRNVSIVKHDVIEVVEASWKVRLGDLEKKELTFLFGGTPKDAVKVLIDATGQKVEFVLKPVRNKHLVYTSVTVLHPGCGAAFRTEENEAVVERGCLWTFSNSLARDEAVEKGLSVLLNLKVVPKGEITHRYSFDMRQFPFEMIAEVSSNAQEHSGATNLANDLKRLYRDRDFSDFEIRSCDGVTFPVHRSILSTRSPVFKVMLCSDMRETASGKANIQDMDSNTLGLFLGYLYSGTVEDMQAESALKLYYAADKYHVPTLRRECVDFLCVNVSLSNVCDVLSVADKHDEDRLTSAAQEFILTNFNEVLESNEWESFATSESLLAVRTLTQLAQKKIVEK